MKVDQFTYTDLAKAGPLFHPESRIRAQGQQALAMRKMANRVMAKRDELLGELNAAQSNAKLRSVLLRHARLAAGAIYLRSVPRRLSPADGIKVATRDLELDVLSSHDRLWAAQRAVAMWNRVYGDLV